MMGPGRGPRGEGLQDGARVRVVIADDTYLIREAIEQILTRQKRAWNECTR